MIDHRDIDRRSLAFGRAIAAKLAHHPELIEKARQTLLRWMKTAAPGARIALQEWLTALDGPLERVIVLLTSEDECSTRLRQSNPFTGILSEVERDAIIRQFHSHDPAAA